MNDRSIAFLELLGYLHLRHGQAARAIAALEAVHRQRRDDPRVLRSLAYAYLSAERYADCLNCLAAAPGPAEARLRLMRSRALWGLGRREEALREAAPLSGGLRGTDAR